jgi:hypothetical protein
LPGVLAASISASRPAESRTATPTLMHRTLEPLCRPRNSAVPSATGVGVSARIGRAFTLPVDEDDA